MRTGPILAREPIARYRPIGAFGQPVYLSHVQLRAGLGQRLGQRYARYFAQPFRERNNPDITWVADAQGQKVRWVDMSPEEQARRALDLAVMKSEIEAYLSELRGAGAAEETRAFASLLEQALIVPDESHLYFVGDQPVIAFWGFQGESRPGLSPLGLTPAHAPRPAAAAPSGDGRPWWRWLLWVLALLILLALLLFGLRACVPPAMLPPVLGGLGPDGKPAPGLAGEIERWVGLGGATLVDGPAVGGTGIGGVTGGGDKAGGAAAPAKPEAASEPKNDPKNDPKGDPKSEPKPEPKSDQKPDQPQTPDQKPEPKPEDKPDQKSDRKPDPASEPPPPDPKALEIPSDAAEGAKLDFLAGEWNNRTGMIDKRDGKPLTMTYRFGQDGKGEVVVRRADGSECKAPAVGALGANGKLTITEQADPTCADGSTFGKSKTECSRDAAGRTVCQGLNADGSAYKVGIERK